MTPETVNESGALLLQRWRETVARYSDERARFVALSHETHERMTPEQRAYVAQLAVRAQQAEAAMSRVGEWLDYGRDLWGAVQPMVNSTGIAGTLKRYGPLAGFSALAIAVKVLSGVAHKLADASQHMRALPEPKQ